MNTCLHPLTTATGTPSFLVFISRQRLPAQNPHRCQTHCRVSSSINSSINSTNTSSNNHIWVLYLAFHQGMPSQSNQSAMVCLLAQLLLALHQRQSSISLPRHMAVWVPHLQALVLLRLV